MTVRLRAGGGTTDPAYGLAGIDDHHPNSTTSGAWSASAKSRESASPTTGRTLTVRAAVQAAQHVRTAARMFPALPGGAASWGETSSAHGRLSVPA